MKKIILSVLCLWANMLHSQNADDYSENNNYWRRGCAHCQYTKNQPNGGGSSDIQNINTNDRSDTIDILHYTIHLDITDFSNEIIGGNCAIRFSPKMNNIASLSLDLLHFSIDSIVLEGQIVGSYYYNDTLLQVPFPLALNDTDTAEIVVYYHGNPPTDASWGGFYFQSGYAYNMGVGFDANPHSVGRMWHPCFDNFVERATYTFHITTNNNKRAHCNGYLAGEAQLGALLTRTWELESPIPAYLACVTVADYATVHQSHAGAAGAIPIELVSLPADTTNFKNSFVNLGTAIDAFEDWYGDYQWNKVGFTVVPFAGGAMEHATTVFYPKFAITGTLSNEGLMAHELGHSWWGNLATCETPEDMWINEGMATYGEFLFYERQYGWNRYISEMKTHHYDVMRNAHAAEGGYLAVSGVPHEYTYGQHVYNKGAVVAHNLRWYLGDALYRQGMSALLANHSFANLNSYQMRDELSANTGIDLSDFFDDWVFAGGFSHFELEKMEVLSQPIPSTYETRVHIQQKGLGTTHFHNNTPLQLSFYDEQWNVHQATVLVSGEYDSATVFVPFLPSVVIINKEHRLNQAREDKQGMLYQVGGSTLMNNMAVQALGDSALFHFEHHLVAPDPASSPAIQLSSRHYWTVTGVFPDTFHATARLSPENYYDNALTSQFGGDSLRLFYRASPDADWQEHPHYNRTQLFSLINFNITDLLPGDYAFGNYFPSLVGVNAAEMQWERSLRLYPNPAFEVLNVEWQAASPALWSLAVYDALGRLLLKQDQQGGAGLQQVQMDLPELPAGIYWLRLQNEKGDYYKTLPFVRK